MKWPAKNHPPPDLHAALTAFMERHPVPDAIHLEWLRLVGVGLPPSEDPDADPDLSPGGVPTDVFGHCIAILRAYRNCAHTIRTVSRKSWSYARR